MITRLTHSFIYVLDLESAINFYTNKIGLHIQIDTIVMDKRWVTLRLPWQPTLEILLIVVEQGMIFTMNQARQMAGIIGEQALSFGVFECSNVRAFYEEAKEKGVEFCILPYHNPQLDIFEAAFLDDSGNWFRITEPRKT